MKYKVDQQRYRRLGTLRARSFRDNSGIGILGIDGICVLLGAVLFFGMNVILFCSFCFL